MTTIFHKAVSSLEAILSSIETDEQVYRWFTLLIIQPEVVKHLASSTSDQLYAKLKQFTVLQRTIYLACFLGLVAVIFWKKFLYLTLGLIVIYPLYKIHKDKKKIVIEISSTLLQKDYEKNELSQKTLYQLCEIYSRKYNIPSLVDTIYALDNISRKAIIFTFIFTAFIYPLKVWQIFLSIFIAFLLIQAVLKTSFIYKNLK